MTDQNFWQVNDHTQAAKKPRDYVDALEEQIFEISKAVGKLRPGTNVFAISVSVKTTENESVIIKPKLVAEKLLPGEEKIGRLRISTPGSANSGLVTEVAPVSASNNSCVFEQPFDLSLACPTSDSAIWYTLVMSSRPPMSDTLTLRSREQKSPAPSGQPTIIAAVCLITAWMKGYLKAKRIPI